MFLDLKVIFEIFRQNSIFEPKWSTSFWAHAFVRAKIENRQMSRFKADLGVFIEKTAINGTFTGSTFV